MRPKASRTSKLKSSQSVEWRKRIHSALVVSPHLAQAGFFPVGGTGWRRLPFPGIAAVPGARPRRVRHRGPLRGPAAAGPCRDPGRPEQAGAGAGAAESVEEAAVQRGEVEPRGGGVAHEQAGNVVAVHGKKKEERRGTPQELRRKQRRGEVLLGSSRLSSELWSPRRIWGKRGSEAEALEPVGVGMNL